VVGDRFLVSFESQKDNHKIVFCNLETNKANQIEIKSRDTNLRALKNGKLLIAMYDNLNVSISVWCEKKSVANGELPFEKIKEINGAHKRHVNTMIELPDKMVATQSYEVINVWNYDLSGIINKLNEDDISDMQHVFDDTLMVNKGKEYLFWNYRKNVVLNRVEIDESSPRLAFATNDKKFLVVLFFHEMKFFATNGFFLYEAFPQSTQLQQCSIARTVVVDGAFYFILGKKFHVFDFKN